MCSYSDGYLRRALAALLGLYGNSVEEVDYTPYLQGVCIAGALRWGRSGGDLWGT
jgi:hypothetical protein